MTLFSAFSSLVGCLVISTNGNETRKGPVLPQLGQAEENSDTRVDWAKISFKKKCKHTFVVSLSPRPVGFMGGSRKKDLQPLFYEENKFESCPTRGSGWS